MGNISDSEKAEDQIFNNDVSDEAMEAAAFAGNYGAYTQFAFCTMHGCPA
jgi:hypothetical protein